MKRIPLTQGKYAKVDDADYPIVSQFKWYYHQTGYAFTGDEHGAKLRLHYAILPRLPYRQVDHINGDRLDNRRSNLRHVIYKHNVWNRGLPSNNSSGYKGISYDKKVDKWRVRIAADRKEYYGGHHRKLRDAVIAYNELASKVHGEFARYQEVPKN